MVEGDLIKFSALGAVAPIIFGVGVFDFKVDILLAEGADAPVLDFEGIFTMGAAVCGSSVQIPFGPIRFTAHMATYK